jgi:hypothetical protein
MPTRKILAPAALALVSLALCAPAHADGFSVISQPGSSYTSTTSLIDITPLTEGSSYSSISDGALTVSFSSSMIRNSVPYSWSYWNCPPATEGCTPPVLWSNGADDVTMSFSQPVYTFGFEAEPDNLSSEEMVATFYSGATVDGTIDLFPSGQAGALLYAASDGTPFTSVEITNTTGDDFAIANVRYGTTPEPASLVLLGTSLVGLAVGRFRSRSRTSANC